MAFDSRKIVTGFNTADGSGGTTDTDATIIAAQGANTVIRIKKAVISVVTAATGGGGAATLEDGAGGTRIVSVPGAAVGVHVIDFGDEGYPLTANTLLNLTVDGATTTEAKATCAAVAVVAS